MSYLGDVRHFLGELRRDFFHTGAVLPSSRFLAREMTEPMRAAQGPFRVLEVGPGTGAVTATILEALRPDAALDIVEINDHFVARLRHRFIAEDAFKRHTDQVTILHAPVQDVAGQGRYDFIISGLPMNNFPVGMVRELFHVFRRLLRPDGTLTYFEYALIRQLKTPLVRRGERRRLRQVGQVVGRQVRRCETGRRLILANVPPAYVRHLELHRGAKPKLR